MPKHVLSDAFIDRLINAGVVPTDTTQVIINARYGEVTTLFYSRLVSDAELIEALAPMKAELR